jgi:hypothetical protein
LAASTGTIRTGLTQLKVIPRKLLVNILTCVTPEEYD